MVSSFKHILAIVLLLLLLFGAYFLTTKSGYFGSGTITAEDIERRTLEIEEDILSGLNQMSEVQLEGAMLTSAEYLFLVDRSVHLADPLVSRSNPFLPY